ncbi:MAG: CDP-diacylglycerol--serine O-phosphatidyltransferase, partial [Rubrivivax sp.]
MNEPARAVEPAGTPAAAAPGGEVAAEVIELPRPKRRGIYVLPNAITLAALFAGFYAVVMAMNGRFEIACIAIFCAAVLDSLDGRVARMTHTQSAFGEQMDSLCDMVGFGAAPALIVYEWALKGLGKAGLIAAFVYCAGAALRLARFNTNIGIVDKRYFQGLPSPAAAALVVGLIWVMDDAGFKNVSQEAWLAWIAFGVTLYAGLTMVTNAPFYSFKVWGGKRTVPFAVIVAIA